MTGYRYRGTGARTATVTRCPDCNQPVLRGKDDHGRTVTVDPVPVDCRSMHGDAECWVATNGELSVNSSYVYGPKPAFHAHACVEPAAGLW